MLDKVKSSYFSERIFSCIDEKQKLKLVKYNKCLQKNLNISIINYIHFQGKYIIYESKRKGREYYSYENRLIFKGEYLNGERNGKGKEYNEYCEVNFEGEYLNGKRNGKGKQYNGDKLIFDGVYLNGKELIGNKFHYDGHLLYQYNNVKGYGKEYYLFGDLLYEGEYLNGLKNGKGKEYYLHGKIKFEGEYLNDKKWEGKGYDTMNNVVYELKDGKGFIKEYSLGKLVFEGEYLNGEKNGKAKEYYDDCLMFEGEYLNDKRSGKGKEYIDNKLIFEGEYLDGKRTGKGKLYNFNGELLFEGQFLYNYFLKGKYYINGKLEFEGEFRCLKRWNGKGYDENGNIIYELSNGNGKVKEYIVYSSAINLKRDIMIKIN